MLINFMLTWPEAGHIVKHITEVRLEIVSNQMGTSKNIMPYQSTPPPSKENPQKPHNPKISEIKYE